MIAAAPRLFAGLMQEADLAPVGERIWGESRLAGPRRTLRKRPDRRAARCGGRHHPHRRASQGLSGRSSRRDSRLSGTLIARRDRGLAEHSGPHTDSRRRRNALGGAVAPDRSRSWRERRTARRSAASVPARLSPRGRSSRGTKCGGPVGTARTRAWGTTGRCGDCAPAGSGWPLGRGFARVR